MTTLFTGETTSTPSEDYKSIYWTEKNSGVLHFLLKISDISDNKVKKYIYKHIIQIIWN
ncbi:hypothetical protein SKUN_001015 [Spiroplasma kunkelii CR2-3x]|uniref:Uncharacterized protein n=1 Tax=Spiroplasma kunkelii CR2-3x TaxID=273035 RepID=A0A0K2JI44_SPIKU|nr:hypothetical protein [Spiroplasma kunkelii]ALA97901.1 hypothetical protein SKUN_001015 [Spiroplasma kunkelii CR2-3x]